MEYFAKIDEPKKLRLSLMKAARESIVMISTLEEVEMIRQRKTELMEEVKEDFKNIEEFCKEMSNRLGDEATRKEMIESFKQMMKEEEKADAKAMKLTPKASPKEKEKEKPQEKPAPKLDMKVKTDVDRLEYTLKQIEQKISDLSKDV